MRSTIRIGFLFVKNRFRSRICVRHGPVVFVMAVALSSCYFIFNYHGYDRYEESATELEPNRPVSNRNNLLKTNVGDRKPFTSPDVSHQYKDVTLHTVLLKDILNTTTTKSLRQLVSRNEVLRDNMPNLTHPSYNKLNSHSSLPILGVLPRVLLMYDNCSVDSAKRLKMFLQFQRVDFDLFSSTKSGVLPALSKLNLETDEVIGRYSLILSADIGFLLHRFAQAERQLLFDYSRAFKVSIISVTRTAFDELKSNTLTNFMFGAHYINSVKSTHMSHVKVDSRRQWVFTKGGVTVTNFPRSAHWLVFLDHPIRSQNASHGNTTNSMIQETTRQLSSDSHLSIEYLQRKIRDYDPNILVKLKYALNNSQTNSFSFQTAPLALIDNSTIAAGTVVVLIGMDIRFWLTNLILLDIINAHTKPSILRFGRERSVMVDIDDIFVAPDGLRMTTDDVEALIAAQERFQSFLPGFKFNLGFCGYYYDKGSEQEQQGNQKLVQNANNFNWFGHLYNHFQPHGYAEEKLVDFMTKNVQFASALGIPVMGNAYSVTPHHSGVYPIHQPLYNAWKRVWNVSVTSTEEYPHLYPNQLRRGFIYQGVMVVPRQTCKLYTHTYSYDTFKGGEEQLIADAEGGSVFAVLLHNPVSVFMTHVTNYAIDRLALQLFDRLFHFVQQWTNLKLATGSPLTLGKRFFDIFPEDKMPFWTCPCQDKRHMEIWSAGKNCSRLPSLLVIGPQKSGTTALYTYLRAHPSIVSNHMTQDHYEEVQFFSNNTLYLRGIEWYMDQFPYPVKSQVVFEKSATYLSNVLAPQRASRLLPKAKVIAILHDPVKRAYSWYQHMRAHKDPTALNYTFSQVIRATPQSPDKKLISLRDHCLSPGRYHIHLSRWLKYYPQKQLYLVDGDRLTKNPAAVMDRVQSFLQVDRVMNYSMILRYNQKKGFYCLSAHERYHCLGPSKGRHYDSMETSDKIYLEELYKHDNLVLKELLKKFSFYTPTWLTFDN